MPPPTSSRSPPIAPHNPHLPAATRCFSGSGIVEEAVLALARWRRPARGGRAASVVFPRAESGQPRRAGRGGGRPTLGLLTVSVGVPPAACGPQRRASRPQRSATRDGRPARGGQPTAVGARPAEGGQQRRASCLRRKGSSGGRPAPMQELAAHPALPVAGLPSSHQTHPGSRPRGSSRPFKPAVF